MSTSPDIDVILELTRAKSTKRFDPLEEVSSDDYTIRELLALATLLRPAYERHLARTENPPTPLKLLRRERRSKG
jgi:hypothetical protein